ncbi:MAG: ABC transporter ATP-binding protein [Ignavibacteriales bacterium]|nr:ABC transporter ATP-binding protein [Ignavibacteriales bacterium]
MLILKDLVKNFGSFTAVNKINLEIRSGELYGFLGPNGAGKTTTIKMITGLLSPTSGKIFLDGIDVWQKPVESKFKIGYIPDQPFLYDKLTGREFLLFSGGLYNLSSIHLKNRIDELIELLRIGSWIDKRTEEYSQGMRQRITIASAFLHDPELIVVDEPMIGLDPQSAFIVKKFFVDKVKNGTTIFMSTHSLNVVEEICTQVGIINKGTIIFDDKLETLSRLKHDRNNNLEELFIQLTNEDETDTSHI